MLGHRLPGVCWEVSLYKHVYFSWIAQIAGSPYDINNNQ